MTIPSTSIERKSFIKINQDTSKRAFASATKAEHKEFEEQVRVALSLIKDEQGKSINESGIIESIRVVNAKERSELLNVIIKVQLTKDFRKIKALV